MFLSSRLIFFLVENLRFWTTPMKRQKQIYSDAILAFLMNISWMYQTRQRTWYTNVYPQIKRTELRPELVWIQNGFKKCCKWKERKDKKLDTQRETTKRVMWYHQCIFVTWFGDAWKSYTVLPHCYWPQVQVGHQDQTAYIDKFIFWITHKTP